MKNIDLHYSWEIKESGLLVRESGIMPAHSFTKQFAQLLFNSVIFGVSAYVPQAMTDTSGNTVSVIGNISNLWMRPLVNASVSTSTFGIQVGTGVGAESINDTALGTQIATGTGVGQLQYGSVTFASPTTTATTTTFRVTRVFTNGSGGTVTVQEIGLTCRGSTSTVRPFLLIRDLTGAVAVNNGQQLTVNYDLTTTI